MRMLKKIGNILVNILPCCLLCLIVVVLIGGAVAKIQSIVHRSTGYVTKTLIFNDGKVKITVKRDGNLGYIYAENKTPYSVRITVFPEVTRYEYGILLIGTFYEEDLSGISRSVYVKSHHEKLVAIYRKKQGSLSTIRVEVYVDKTGEMLVDQFFW